MSDRDIHIGGNSSGVNVTGDGNVVSTSYQKVTLPSPESVDITKTLESLREVLAQLTLKRDDHAQITTAIDAAAQEAKTDNPDRQSIGSQVEKALGVAKTAGDFIDVCKQAGSHVVDATAWLGENWHKLLPLVSLTL